MTSPRRPPGRYDEPRALPRPVLVGGAAVLVLVAIALSYLTYERFTGDRARFAVVGFSVVDDQTVEVTFRVSKAAGDAVVCRVRARDRDGAEVGAELVTVGPSAPAVTTHRLTTSRRASTGEVSGCADASSVAPTPSGTPAP